MIVRPGQVGQDVFEAIDFEAWQRTGERRPATRTAATGLPS
jgi:hypothetical protein